MSETSRRTFLRSSAAAVAAAHYAALTELSVARAEPSKADQGYPLSVPGYFGSRPGIQVGIQL